MYVVSPTGNDSDAGTVDAPFLTIAHALAAAAAADTIYLREGTYLEAVVVNKAVTLASWPDETAIILPNAGVTSDAVLVSANGVVLDRLVVNGLHRLKGIAITAAHVVIQYCEIYGGLATVAGQYAHGIIVAASDLCHDIIVKYCTIHDITSEIEGDRTFCHGIYSACAGMQVIGCEMYALGGHGVHWYAAQGGDLVVAGCYIHTCHSGVGCYVSRALVYNNVIDACLLGLIARYDVQDARFYHNTVLRCLAAIDSEALEDAVTVEYANNVLYNNTFAVHIDQELPTTAVVSIHHNLRDGHTLPDYQGRLAAAYVVSHIDAAFAPITSDNAAIWRPRAGNPALAAGVAIDGITVDREGTRRPDPPSVGAYERRRGCLRRAA